MRTYALHTATSTTPFGIIEFPRTPHWEEILDALLIRGDLIGLRRDIYDSYYVCQGGVGALHVYFSPEQRLAFRLEPQPTGAKT